MSGSAQEVVRRHELSIPPARRRRLGAHYTPPDLARRLVDDALDALGATPRLVVDPCCGAGSFLLAAADALADRGVGAAEVVGERLAGADVDPAAAAAARDALRRWAAGRGAADPGVRIEPRVVVADTLLAPPGDWVGRVDLVVGNPPFLGQLASTTARGAAERAAVAARFDVAAYTDAAGLFLVAATRLVGPGGVVTLVQPQSVLGARDAGPVRGAVLRDADLVALWADDADHFDAAVRVCAPTLRRVGRDAAPGPPPVRVRWGELPAVELAAPGPGDPWGPLLAPSLGIPAVPPPPPGAPRLGSLAGATAGFRDEFYALAAAARDRADAGDPGDDDPGGVDPVDGVGGLGGVGGVGGDGPPLVTVGMVDAATSWWGRRPARLGGRAVTAPRLDTSALVRDAPRVAAWVSARRCPKVLVATQTRAVEAVVDPTGDLVPVTPLISVEPVDPGDVWRVGAALLAPPVSARVAAELLGSGRSTGAVRWSARRVLDTALPLDAAAWERGADLLARAQAEPDRRPRLLGRLGAVMCAAHGLPPDHPVLSWWCPLVGAVGPGA